MNVSPFNHDRSHREGIKKGFPAPALRAGDLCARLTARAKLQIFSLVTLACLVIASLPGHRILAWSSFLSVFFFFLLFIYLDSTFLIILIYKNKKSLKPSARIPSPQPPPHPPTHQQTTTNNSNNNNNNNNSNNNPSGWGESPEPSPKPSRIPGFWAGALRAAHPSPPHPTSPAQPSPAQRVCVCVCVCVYSELI